MFLKIHDWSFFAVRLAPGGVRTTIAKHHGRYSKSDRLSQDVLENGAVGLTWAVLEEIKLVEGRQKRETKL